MPEGERESGLRWRTTVEDDAGRLFSLEELGERHLGVGEYRGMEFLHVRAQRIINPVPAKSRMSFRYTINAYRGCSHACVYCFARPTHAYLNLGIGEDFERKIVVKVNAVERVRAELASSRWVPTEIAMGTNTDPYQKAEGRYHLTRGIVEALSAARNPFSILTKSTLVLRDLELLATSAQRTSVRLNFSIGTLDTTVSRESEPGAPPPQQRLEAVRRLNAAGIACGVLIAPVLPGLSDREDELVELARACRDAGAVSVSVIGLHLRPGIREHYLEWLNGRHPELGELYAQRFRDRAYQERTELERLSAIVRRALSPHSPRD